MALCVWNFVVGLRANIENGKKMSMNSISAISITTFQITQNIPRSKPRMKPQRLIHWNREREWLSETCKHLGMFRIVDDDKDFVLYDFFFLKLNEFLRSYRMKNNDWCNHKPITRTCQQKDGGATSQLVTPDHRLGKHFAKKYPEV